LPSGNFPNFTKKLVAANKTGGSKDSLGFSALATGEDAQDVPATIELA
jgi:hypothetical protein